MTAIPEEEVADGASGDGELLDDGGDQHGYAQRPEGTSLQTFTRDSPSVHRSQQDGDDSFQDTQDTPVSRRVGRSPGPAGAYRTPGRSGTSVLSTPTSGRAGGQLMRSVSLVPHRLQQSSGESRTPRRSSPLSARQVPHGAVQPDGLSPHASPGQGRVSPFREFMLSPTRSPDGVLRRQTPQGGGQHPLSEPEDAERIGGSFGLGGVRGGVPRRRRGGLGFGGDRVVGGRVGLGGDRGGAGLGGDRGGAGLGGDRGAAAGRGRGGFGVAGEGVGSGRGRGGAGLGGERRGGAGRGRGGGVAAVARGLGRGGAAQAPDRRARQEQLAMQRERAWEERRMAERAVAGAHIAAHRANRLREEAEDDPDPVGARENPEMALLNKFLVARNQQPAEPDGFHHFGMLQAWTLRQLPPRSAGRVMLSLGEVLAAEFERHFVDQK
ncbi:Collagen alpha-5(VI) chain [Frankliniella fusca]|uniref:Collagen alpha-5(VI) chain n=1 Tax=Frankliniella fusca TaxID=407009 RepID=A0AAE1HZY1_9NEOP|nr:Collagen alpha-5(VI) chain [Frankliniella fusca]